MGVAWLRCVYRGCSVVEEVQQHVGLFPPDLAEWRGAVLMVGPAVRVPGSAPRCEAAPATAAAGHDSLLCRAAATPQHR